MPDQPNPQSMLGWSAYEKLVMTQLAQLENDMQAVDEKITLLRIDVAQLKVKAGIWGAVAGLIPGVVMVLATLVAGS